MRECNNCIRCTPNIGCTAWDCDFISRKDAIELYKSVTRCKDCKYAEKESETEYWCNEWGMPLVGGDGFCSWGEKKEERTEPESLLEAMAKFRAEEGAER